MATASHDTSAEELLLHAYHDYESNMSKHDESKHIYIYLRRRVSQVLRDVFGHQTKWLLTHVTQDRTPRAIHSLRLMDCLSVLYIFREAIYTAQLPGPGYVALPIEDIRRRVALQLGVMYLDREVLGPHVPHPVIARVGTISWLRIANILKKHPTPSACAQLLHTEVFLAPDAKAKTIAKAALPAPRPQLPAMLAMERERIMRDATFSACVAEVFFGTDDTFAELKAICSK